MAEIVTKNKMEKRNSRVQLSPGSPLQEDLIRRVWPLYSEGDNPLGSLVIDSRKIELLETMVEDCQQRLEDISAESDAKLKKIALLSLMY